MQHPAIPNTPSTHPQHILGTGEGHEIGWAAPLGRVLSLGGPLHTINTGPGVHLYNTDQFSNDVWWFTQVYTSPLRVATYEEADVVFVPGMFARADPGMESEADYAVGFRYGRVGL